MSSNGTNGNNGANGKGANGNVNGNGNGHKHVPRTHWSSDPRWDGITRPYSYSDVLRLRGSIQIEYTLAKLGAERLWNLMHTEQYVPALGAITGNQAIEMVQAGLKAIYGSGWQVALVRADCRGCRSGLRRIAERVRADESDDRSGRRGRAFRRSTFFRQKVRASRRESRGARP
jgi:hypothetical protein